MPTSRKKHWYEMNTEEKIEELREAVEKIQDGIERRRKQLSPLFEHRHDGNTIVTPLRGQDCESVGSLYFRGTRFKTEE